MGLVYSIRLDSNAKLSLLSTLCPSSAVKELRGREKIGSSILIFWSDTDETVSLSVFEVVLGELDVMTGREYSIFRSLSSLLSSTENHLIITVSLQSSIH